VVGVSRFILDRHNRGGFFPNSGTKEVIFNSIRCAGRKPLMSRNGPLRFGFIGRICPEKGIQWLLEAFTASARPSDSLVVAGKGETGFVEALKARFSSPSVRFIGHVNPVVFYEQVDVVVIPSLWNEPFGRTAIESLAHGIPVIATKRGGLTEIIRDGTTGIVVDPDEPGSLVHALRRFSTEPDVVRRLARNGADELSAFSEDVALDRYLGLYAGVVSNREGQAIPVTGTRSAPSSPPTA
jgi:glycosyltransferase involved in cell wall biosynthesis